MVSCIWYRVCMHRVNQCGGPSPKALKCSTFPLTYCNRRSTFRLPLTQSVSLSVISGVPKTALSTASTPSMNYRVETRAR